MRSLVYFSTATAPMSAEVLAALGDECAENDSHVGITGMLLHKQGDFLQVIEGPCGSVGDMYVRIAADPRHKDMRKVCDRVVDCREFDGPAVGFKNLDGLPWDTPFLNPFSYEAFAADPDLAVLVLSYFFRTAVEKFKTVAMLSLL